MANTEYIDVFSSSNVDAIKQVKMNSPFNLNCESCDRRTNKGDKLCGLKEIVGKDPTFDVDIYRFKFSCPSCRKTFSIKSDPGQYDYVLEAGATLPSK